MLPHRQFRLGIKHAAGHRVGAGGQGLRAHRHHAKAPQGDRARHGPLAHRVPERLRRSLCRMSGVLEAVSPAAALGAPWLPQTFLMPVRRGGISPDDPAGDAAWAPPLAECILRRHLDLQWRHMHDANQDRLMIAGMSYFRFKWRRFPHAYAWFLTETLARGATLLYIVDCRSRWPVHRHGPRHVFPFGGAGGMSPQEYHQGSERIRAYLGREAAAVRAWQPPSPNDRAPEAERGRAGAGR